MLSKNFMTVWQIVWSVMVFFFFADMEQLAEHGVTLPPNMQGLTDEQIEELKLRDEWGEKCEPQGGFVFKKDTVGCRNGKGKFTCWNFFLILFMCVCVF
jgi:hypothetical protein